MKFLLLSFSLSHYSLLILCLTSSLLTSYFSEPQTNHYFTLTMVRRRRVTHLTQPTNVHGGKRRSQQLAQTSPSETLSEMNCEEVPLEPESSMISEGAPTLPQTGPPTSASTQELVGEPERQIPELNPTGDNTHKHDVAC